MSFEVKIQHQSLNSSKILILIRLRLMVGGSPFKSQLN